MIKLSTKVDRWLALVADDRAPADQERGSREAVRLAVAAARLSERYRVGLVSLAKLRGWEGFRKGSAAAGRRVDPDDLAAAAEVAAALLGDDGLDDGPHDDPNGGGPKGSARAAAAKALQQLQALRGRYSNGHTNGHAKPNGKENPPSHFGRGPGGGLGAGSNSSSANPNRGQLRHGNPSGDFLAAPRCGAQTRAACPCRQPAMSNGRCRLHGGKSTGARTASGLARVRANRLVHGARSAEIIDLRSAAARHGQTLRTLARLAKAPAPADPQSERSTPCPATTPDAPNGRLGHAETRRRGLSEAPHLRVSASPRDILPSERSTCPATPRATAPSASIPSYPRPSAVKPSPATAPNPPIYRRAAAG